jgi:hypothetical protein
MLLQIYESGKCLSYVLYIHKNVYISYIIHSIRPSVHRALHLGKIVLDKYKYNGYSFWERKFGKNCYFVITCIDIVMCIARQRRDKHLLA